MVIRHGMRGRTLPLQKWGKICSFTGLKVLNRGRETNTWDRRRRRWEIAWEKGVEHGS